MSTSSYKEITFTENDKAYFDLKSKTFAGFNGRPVPSISTG